jgi:hemerythrin-like metal-binding protein
MDDKYRCGIPEIDAQHEAIYDLVVELQVLITDKSRRQLLHPMLRQLNQRVATHFEYEESLLAMVNDDDLIRHEKMHAGVLRVFNDYFKHPRSSADYDHFAKTISDKILEHVLDHDVHMMSRIREYLAARHASVPKAPISA